MYYPIEDFEDCGGAEEHPDYLEHAAIKEEPAREKEISLRFRIASDHLRSEVLRLLREAA